MEQTPGDRLRATLTVKEIRHNGIDGTDEVEIGDIATPSAPPPKHASPRGFVPAIPGEARRMVMDVRRANHVLGWRHSARLPEGVDSVIGDIRQLAQQEAAAGRFKLSNADSARPR